MPANKRCVLILLLYEFAFKMLLLRGFPRGCHCEAFSAVAISYEGKYDNGSDLRIEQGDDEIGQQTY